MNFKLTKIKSIVGLIIGLLIGYMYALNYTPICFGSCSPEILNKFPLIQFISVSIIFSSRGFICNRMT